ncbi:MAG: hypothetical protein IJ094_05300 [Bacilli bacterium]|nr:hypothetical protein [Bacilli bacterium]
MNKYTPDEIINLYLKYEKENQKNLYYGEVEEFVADSDEKIAFKFISKILFRIYEREDGIMGMYVNPAFLCQQNEYSIEQYKPEIKLYINANKDTYHFSKLFSDECIKKDICYNYKVAMPNHELSRIERMCIYSTIENLPKYIEILQKIISEHPEFEYGDLPLFAGKINGVIGVGVDPKETSYNQQISEILRNTCNEFFNCTSLFDKNREQAKNLSGARKEEFKQFLIEKIASAGMDPQKLCITNDVAELLKQIKMPKLDINSINTKK